MFLRVIETSKKETAPKNIINRQLGGHVIRKRILENLAFTRYTEAWKKSF